MDSAQVSLLALDTSKGINDGAQSGLAVKLLLRFSFTCVSISELLFTQQIFLAVNLRHRGWWWRKLGPVAILTLTLLKFLPFIEYSHASIVELAYANLNCNLHKETLHFWTVFSASFLEFLLFSLIYWWTLINSKDHRKWRSGLAGSSILCSTVVLAALVSSGTGWKLPWVRHLLLEILLLLVSIQFSLRCVYIENTLTGQVPTKSRERIPDEASNESVRILNHGTGCRKTSTSTSRKPLSRDKDDPVELYAWSVLQIQAATKQGIRGGKMNHTHASDCTMVGVSTDPGETGLLSTAQTLVDYPLLSTSSFRSDIVLQRTSLLKGPLVLAVLNNRYSAPAPRHRRPGSQR